MLEEDTIFEFNIRIRDIDNVSLSLGFPMDDDKLVGKILRAVPEDVE